LSEYNVLVTCEMLVFSVDTELHLLPS